MIKVRQAVLAGVCGYEKEFMGKIIHLLPTDKIEEAAICGRAPTGKSKGWSSSDITWLSPGYAREIVVNCKKCRKALAEGRCEMA